MQSMLTDRVANPEFAVVVRGYDRAQVDEYLGELLAWLSEAERRVMAADQANDALRREVVQLRAAAASLEERAGVPGPQSLNAFSERMGQVMQSAVAAADELRAESEREANERRDAVAAEVERMLDRAKAEARDVLRRARVKERELEESIASLAARRATAVEELGRLHHQLSELLAAPDAPASPAPSSGEPPPTPTESVRAAEPAALASAPTSPHARTPELEGAAPADLTETLPTVHPEASGPARTSAPTVVQGPGRDSSGKRSGPR